MASRSSSSNPSSGNTRSVEPGQTQRKSRAEGDRAKARASGGGLRSEPAAPPAGRSASTGGRADRSSVRSDRNSRSSNAGGGRKG